MFDTKHQLPCLLIWNGNAWTLCTIKNEPSGSLGAGDSLHPFFHKTNHLCTLGFCDRIWGILVSPAFCWELQLLCEETMPMPPLQCVVWGGDAHASPAMCCVRRRCPCLSGITALGAQCAQYLKIHVVIFMTSCWHFTFGKTWWHLNAGQLTNWRLPPGGAVPSEKWGAWPIKSMEKVLCLSHLIEQSMPDLLLQLQKMKLHHPTLIWTVMIMLIPSTGCMLQTLYRLWNPTTKNSNLAVKGVALPVSFTNTIQHMLLDGQYTFVHHTHKNQMESQLLWKTNPNLPPSPRSA